MFLLRLLKVSSFNRYFLKNFINRYIYIYNEFYNFRNYAL